ncbi:MAG: glucokinase [Acidobacteria bacterium]|nr:glucokinase [Acidobacteriota bacterium]
MIIAGDIGGTKTNVALFENDGRALGRIVAQQNFLSGQYGSLEAILREFISSHAQQPVTHACFGVAGPVVSGRSHITNLKWLISEESLAETLKLGRVGLINDLEATAHGIGELHPSNLFTLNEGVEAAVGHRALIAAGTGLGMTGIFWDGQRHHPMPGEGGHLDFAPRNEREIELLRYMTEKLNGHVSYERVLSGMGLLNIYSFLRDRKYAEEPAWLAEEIAGGDHAAAISRAALSHKSELATLALDMLVGVYGAMAGNLALLFKPFGGLYIGGGIAPKILEKLTDGTFMRAYGDKGRMSWIVESIPVRIILDDKTALYGAARCALCSVT